MKDHPVLGYNVTVNRDRDRTTVTIDAQVRSRISANATLKLQVTLNSIDSEIRHDHRIRAFEAWVHEVLATELNDHGPE